MLYSYVITVAESLKEDLHTGRTKFVGETIFKQTQELAVWEGTKSGLRTKLLLENATTLLGIDPDLIILRIQDIQ